MKLSTRGEYGLRAMLYLAMKETSGEHLLQAQEISEAQDIPAHYLKQILSRLRAAGLVRATRGPSGGHGLARPASEISVGEVIQCLEGQLTSVKEFLVEIKTEVERLLYQKTLAQLAGRQDELSQKRILVQPRIMRPPGSTPQPRPLPPVFDALDDDDEDDGA
jgi:Rrf2 family protein